VQKMLGVGTGSNICFAHVLVAVRQVQRRDAAATEESTWQIFSGAEYIYLPLSSQWQFNSRGDVLSTSLNQWP
jgi:hypothetical protein